MIKFYCYTKCSTCKKAQKFLDEHNIVYELIDIKSYQFTSEEIKLIHQKSGKEIKRLFNTSGIKYRELNIKEKIKDLDLNNTYEILASDGMLIKRPLLVTDKSAYIGFNIAEYEDFVSRLF